MARLIMLRLLNHVFVFLALLTALLGNGGCKRASSNQSKLDKASAWTLTLLNQYLGRLKENQFDGKQSVIQRMMNAKGIIQSHPHLPGNNPYLLSAFFGPKPDSIRLDWMQRHYDIQGIYLKDIDGRVVRFTDRTLSMNINQQGYADTTFLRWATFRFRRAGDSQGATPEAAAILPEDFIEKGMKAGLVLPNGKLSPAIVILKQEITKGTSTVNN